MLSGLNELDALFLPVCVSSCLQPVEYLSRGQVSLRNAFLRHISRLKDFFGQVSARTDAFAFGKDAFCVTYRDTPHHDSFLVRTVMPSP